MASSDYCRLTVRGCARGCVTCGASHAAFQRFMRGRYPLLRSPASVAAQVRQLAELTRASIFLVGDLRDGGDAYARDVLEALAGAPVNDRIVFEFFDLRIAQYPVEGVTGIQEATVWLSRIRAALRDGGFVLSFQPVIQRDFVRRLKDLGCLIALARR